MTRLFDYGSKRIIEVDDEMKVKELIDSKQAIELDLPRVEDYEKKARDIYDRYIKDVERIKESENPVMQDPKVQKYELDKLEQEYRKQSQEIEEKYQAYRKSSIEDAKVKAAQASIKLSDKDKQVAEQFATRAGLTLTAAYEQEKSEVVMRIVDDIRLLTDEQRTALQAQASQLLANVDEASDKRKLIQAMQEVRNKDLLALEVAKQLPHSILTMQRINDISKKVVSESTFSHADNAIDREFYEKHLKVSDK